MTTTPVSPPPVGQRRPLLGLRRRPGRLALMFMRMPLRAYRHDAGWMLGHTFMEFTHVGRKTGQPHDAVAMVLRHDEATRETVICAAWTETDWYRNLRAGPAAKVQLGRDSFTPEHRFLTEGEAFDVTLQFRREHPHRLHLITRILGWGDLREDDAVREFVRAHPFIAFRPAAPEPSALASSVRMGDDRVVARTRDRRTAGAGNRRASLPPRWFVVAFWHGHRALVRLTRGRLGLWRPKPDGWGTLRLTTTGRRTGRPRQVLVGYFEDGRDLVTMAMNGWGVAEPSWWLNLQAHPDAIVETRDGPRRVRARSAAGAERERLWSRWAEIDKNLDAYAARRPTETAVVVLEPRGGPEVAAEHAATDDTAADTT
jgi:deazaflavin-dependent oxidoreductase (nitroreductase family)